MINSFNEVGAITTPILHKEKQSRRGLISSQSHIANQQQEQDSNSGTVDQVMPLTTSPYSSQSVQALGILKTLLEVP